MANLFQATTKDLTSVKTVSIGRDAEAGLRDGASGFPGGMRKKVSLRRKWAVERFPLGVIWALGAMVRINAILFQRFCINSKLRG